MAETKKKSNAVVVAVVVWTCLNLYLCNSANVDHGERLSAGTDRDFAMVASFMLYSVIWVGGLVAIALVKFIAGKR
jgi:hypothetical protein